MPSIKTKSNEKIRYFDSLPASLLSHGSQESLLAPAGADRSLVTERDRRMHHQSEDSDVA
jgi:hypothetical protein